MTSPIVRCAAVLAALCGASPVLAKDKQDEPLKRAAAVQKIYDCRTIAEPAARLACYDSSVAALEAAEAKREVTIADQEVIKETRRGLFGFSLPRIGLFGRDDDSDAVTEIEATVQSAVLDRQGRYRIVMVDGAVWQQIDATPLPRDPKPGHKVQIKTAALGSYFAKVDGQRAIRMQRVR